MNEYVFDQIYGSEAKKIKITQGKNYTYYQTLLKLKDRHANNKTLYNNLFEQPQQHMQTIDQPEYVSPNKIREKSHKKIFNSLQKNNYTIQKINSHVYKILKRKSYRNGAPGNVISVNLKNIQNGNISTAKPDKWVTNIKTDASKIRRYLQSTQTKRQYRTISNFSTQLSARNKNQSRYSNNGDSIEKNKSFRISSTRF